MSVRLLVATRNRDTSGETVSADAGRQRDVRERAVAVVPIEPVVVRGIGLIQLWLACPVHKVDIGLPVAVIVEDGHTTNHGLDLAPCGSSRVLQDELDARASGDIFESDRVGLRRYGGAGVPHQDRGGGKNSC